MMKQQSKQKPRGETGKHSGGPVSLVGNRLSQKIRDKAVSFEHQVNECRLYFGKPVSFEQGSDTTRAMIPGS